MNCRMFSTYLGRIFFSCERLIVSASKNRLKLQKALRTVSGSDRVPNFSDEEEDSQTGLVDEECCLIRGRIVRSCIVSFSWMSSPKNGETPKILHANETPRHCPGGSIPKKDEDTRFLKSECKRNNQRHLSSTELTRTETSVQKCTMMTSDVT